MRDSLRASMAVHVHSGWCAAISCVADSVFLVMLHDTAQEGVSHMTCRECSKVQEQPSPLQC